MELSIRQQAIIKIVKANQPISGTKIAEQLHLSRATLRNDFAILTMTGILDARPKVGYFYVGQEVMPLLTDELYQETVGQLMVPPLLIPQTTTIDEAVTQLFMHDVGSLYVTDEQSGLLGVLSRKDLLRATINTTNTQTTPVAMIMTRMPNITTTTEETSVLHAGQRLIAHQVDSLPVVAIDGITVIGKITKSIIMRYFIEAGLHNQS
ncbi:helix-turn-helix transcriptional regulator [Latilactobacillus sp. 5-91]|uniref:helix-turn-helix transcriptional regulator n=1 Tax=Latilactobacillus sp. 5-91 TaxID=3410924 RepID=UPI003C7177F4